MEDHVTSLMENPVIALIIRIQIQKFELKKIICAMIENRTDAGQVAGPVVDHLVEGAIGGVVADVHCNDTKTPCHRAGPSNMRIREP